MHRPPRPLGVLLILGVLSTLLIGGRAVAAACADASHAGGDWPALNHDLSNTRSQPLEDTIDVTSAPLLAPAWVFSAQDHGATGQIQSTPTIAEGCAYITTSSGWVFALNADSGELVWNERLATTVSGVCCGGTLFAPAVVDGVLYVNVSNNPETSPDLSGPHVVAMDAHTGQILWRSLNVASEPGAYTNSSAVYYDGMIFIGISNPEMGFHYIGGFALVDAETGVIIKRTHTIPEEQSAQGYAGGAIWSTAAVDPATGYAYAATGQPSDWAGKESERVNAILKIDLARARDANGDPVASEAITNPTFGEIVDARKGTADDPPYIDVDFAASPNLYHDADGNQMVAAFQKSGWLHAAHTRHMTPAWSTPLAPFGTALGNYSTTATDGTNIYGVGTYPGQMWKIDGTTGRPLWVSPVLTTIGGNPVTYANGVVYHADGKGFLDAYDAATGAPLMHRPMSLDTGGLCTNAGGGVSIARNTVYAACGDRGVQFNIGPTDDPGGWIIAYRRPA